MRAIALLAGASMLGYGATAWAQDSAPAMGSQTPSSAAQDHGGLEEIIVTAQKREQRLQDVPVAVTALTSEALQSRGINDVAAVANAVPSLTITQSNSPASNSINIRGIGTSAFSTGVEPAVAERLIRGSGAANHRWRSERTPVTLNGRNWGRVAATRRPSHRRQVRSKAAAPRASGEWLWLVGSCHQQSELRGHFPATAKATAFSMRYR
ncbi:TonB-dependent receptor plug domain-containing protein [Sphingomonas sp. 22176]|uniref:TonB-dependent receptor plug domain-containing protein n=1 Tax=Sphingomonas sp. 22176 TaxID=3453884 RepID=UPI003F83B3A7